MTKTLTTAYSSSTFNTAADINPQLKAFEGRKGESFIYETLRPLFHKYGLEEVFGVGLLHRHFSVASDEKLVENGNVTSPWKGVQVGLNSFLGQDVHLIYETSWMLDPDTKKWMAYEFGFSPVQGWDLGWGKKCVKLDDPKYADFLREYSRVITENGWEQLLGLQAWVSSSNQLRTWGIAASRLLQPVPLFLHKSLTSPQSAK